MRHGKGVLDAPIRKAGQGGGDPDRDHEEDGEEEIEREGDGAAAHRRDGETGLAGDGRGDVDLGKEGDELGVGLPRVPARAGFVTADVGADAGAIFLHPVAEFLELDRAVLLTVVAPDQKGGIFGQHGDVVANNGSRGL